MERRRIVGIKPKVPLTSTNSMERRRIVGIKPKVPLTSTNSMERRRIVGIKPESPPPVHHNDAKLVDIHPPSSHQNKTGGEPSPRLP